MNLQKALSDLLNAVGVVVGVLLTTYLPILRVWLKSHVKNRAAAQTLDQLAVLAQWAVSEVEPAAADSASPSGSDKKRAAVKIVKAGLKQDVPDKVVSAAVESAVSKMHLAYGKNTSGQNVIASESTTQNLTQSATQPVSQDASMSEIKAWYDKHADSQSQADSQSASQSNFHWGGEQHE